MRRPPRCRDVTVPRSAGRRCDPACRAMRCLIRLPSPTRNAVSFRTLQRTNRTSLSDFSAGALYCRVGICVPMQPGAAVPAKREWRSAAEAYLVYPALVGPRGRRLPSRRRPGRSGYPSRAPSPGSVRVPIRGNCRRRPKSGIVPTGPNSVACHEHGRAARPELRDHRA